MALELKQSVKLSQQLVITPQLQLAIKLLQLSQLELQQEMEQQLLENPVLELDADPPEGSEEQELRAQLWDYFQPRSSLPRNVFTDDEELPSRTGNLTKAESLTDHLIWQMRLSDFNEGECRLGSYIIGNLDDNGYLCSNLAELADQAKVDEADVEGVLAKVQEFDPPGVAARDLRECLLLQVKGLGVNEPALEKIIACHLRNLEKKDYEAIARELSLSVEEVAAAAKVISYLEPKPGRPFSRVVAAEIVPDVFIYKDGDDYLIRLNDDGAPKLSISAIYKLQSRWDKSFSSPEDRRYLRQKMKEAEVLIKSIDHRQRTIYKVVESIIKFQRDFLDRGIEFLRPLIIRVVADDIGMHESTVSRVTSNKYAQTPRGLFELKFFFNSGLQGTQGGSVASGSVKEKIRELIANENGKRPYSDQELARLFRERNIKVARRTVTKYRESMGILSSVRRKRLF
ncbi:MAG: RNA polymerase factor sigma-54 [Thermodesulfobacteriota bacterium]